MRNSQAAIVGLILIVLAALAAATHATDVGARLDLRTIRDCHDALLNKKALEYHAHAAQDVNDSAAAAGSCPRISSWHRRITKR